MKTITPTKPFFTELDFNPAFDGQLSSVKAAQAANAKARPLVEENARLRDHFENCHADKIVTLKLENTKLRAALEYVIAHEKANLEYNPDLHRHDGYRSNMFHKCLAALSGKGDGG